MDNSKITKAKKTGNKLINVWKLLCSKAEQLVLSSAPLLPLPLSTGDYHWMLWTSIPEAEFIANSFVILNHYMIDWILDRPDTSSHIDLFQSPFLLYQTPVSIPFVLVFFDQLEICRILRSCHKR